MADDVIINKIAHIERCIARIREEYQGHEAEITTNLTKQDAIILNLQRASEMAIDLGTRIVRLENLGVPQTSREVFALLEQKNIIPKTLSEHLQAMVGFRNIALHDYTALNLDIVEAIIQHHLQDFIEFNMLLLKRYG